MKRLDSLSGQSGKGPGLTRGRDWPCGKCSHSEKPLKTRPAGFGGHRERDRAKATSRLSPGKRGPWEGGRLMRGGLTSSPGRTSGKPGRCQDPPGILCPASAGAEVAGGVMWVVGSAHSWDAMGSQPLAPGDEGGSGWAALPTQQGREGLQRRGSTRPAQASSQLKIFSL